MLSGVQILLGLMRDEVVAKAGSRLLGSSCRKVEGHIRAIIASGIPVTRALAGLEVQRQIEFPEEDSIGARTRNPKPWTPSPYSTLVVPGKVCRSLQEQQELSLGLCGILPRHWCRFRPTGWCFQPDARFSAWSCRR